MADDQLAGTGHRGQFWLDNASGTLTRLGQVVSFNIPTAERDEVETTHLDSDAKEFAPGLIDFGTFEVVLNFRPGSDTDELLEDAASDEGVREFKAVVPIRGELAKDYTGTGFVRGYERGDITPDGKMEATVTIRVTGAVTGAAHAA
ncbi:MAG TPA: phage tail tube protein [Sphingomicrobium sp.]|jgi:hypothetical protein